MALVLDRRLAFTAPALARRPVLSRLRLLRRWLRRRHLARRFIGHDHRMLEDIGIALTPDRPFPPERPRR